MNKKEVDKIIKEYEKEKIKQKEYITITEEQLYFFTKVRNSKYPVSILQIVKIWNDKLKWQPKMSRFLVTKYLDCIKKKKYEIIKNGKNKNQTI